jgi:hypothetical protein
MISPRGGLGARANSSKGKDGLQQIYELFKTSQKRKKLDADKKKGYLNTFSLRLINKQFFTTYKKRIKEEATDVKELAEQSNPVLIKENAT